MDMFFSPTLFRLGGGDTADGDDVENDDNSTTRGNGHSSKGKSTMTMAAAAVTAATWNATPSSLLSASMMHNRYIHEVWDATKATTQEGKGRTTPTDRNDNKSKKQKKQPKSAKRHRHRRHRDRSRQHYRLRQSRSSDLSSAMSASIFSASASASTMSASTGSTTSMASAVSSNSSTNYSSEEEEDDDDLMTKSELSSSWSTASSAVGYGGGGCTGVGRMSLRRLLMTSDTLSLTNSMTNNQEETVVHSPHVGKTRSPATLWRGPPQSEKPTPPSQNLQNHNHDNQRVYYHPKSTSSDDSYEVTRLEGSSIDRNGQQGDEDLRNSGNDETAEETIGDDEAALDVEGLAVDLQDNSGGGKHDDSDKGEASWNKRMGNSKKTKETTMASDQKKLYMKETPRDSVDLGEPAATATATATDTAIGVSIGDDTDIKIRNAKHERDAETRRRWREKPGRLGRKRRDNQRIQGEASSQKNPWLTTTDVPPLDHRACPPSEDTSTFFSGQAPYSTRLAALTAPGSVTVGDSDQKRSNDHDDAVTVVTSNLSSLVGVSPCSSGKEHIGLDRDRNGASDTEKDERRKDGQYDTNDIKDIIKEINEDNDRKKLIMGQILSSLQELQVQNHQRTRLRQRERRQHQQIEKLKQQQQSVSEVTVAAISTASALSEKVNTMKHVLAAPARHLITRLATCDHDNMRPEFERRQYDVTKLSRRRNARDATSRMAQGYVGKGRTRHDEDDERRDDIVIHQSSHKDDRLGPLNCTLPNDYIDLVDYEDDSDDESERGRQQQQRERLLGQPTSTDLNDESYSSGSDYGSDDVDDNNVALSSSFLQDKRRGEKSKDAEGPRSWFRFCCCANCERCFCCCYCCYHCLASADQQVRIILRKPSPGMKKEEEDELRAIGLEQLATMIMGSGHANSSTSIKPELIEIVHVQESFVYQNDAFHYGETEGIVFFASSPLKPSAKKYQRRALPSTQGQEERHSEPSQQHQSLVVPWWKREEWNVDVKPKTLPSTQGQEERHSEPSQQHQSLVVPWWKREEWNVDVKPKTPPPPPTTPTKASVKAAPTELATAPIPDEAASHSKRSVDSPSKDHDNKLNTELAVSDVGSSVEDNDNMNVQNANNRDITQISQDHSNDSIAVTTSSMQALCSQAMMLDSKENRIDENLLDKVISVIIAPRRPPVNDIAEDEKAELNSNNCR